MRGGPVTQSTTNLITVSLLPVAILMIGYALTTFLLRSIYLQRKQVSVAIYGCHSASPCVLDAIAETLSTHTIWMGTLPQDQVQVWPMAY